MPKCRKKKRSPKRVLALPDPEQSKTAVLNSLTSKSGQQTDDHQPTPRRRSAGRLRGRRFRLAQSGACGRNPTGQGSASNWSSYRGLTNRRAGKTASGGYGPNSLRGKRNYAILAILIGCGLRRGELLGIRAESLQLRDEHWVIRTVPVPAWVKEAVDAWQQASGITEGSLFRSINKAGRVWGKRNDAQGALGNCARGGDAGRDRETRPARPSYLRQAVPSLRWRTGSDPVPTWPRFDPDHRAVPRVQTEVPRCGQRPDGQGAQSELMGNQRGAGSPPLRDYLRVVSAASGLCTNDARVESPTYVFA